MANPEHVDRLLQGVEAWNQWREENPEIKPDLSAANLRGVDLYHANLNSANLNSADLSSAFLSESNLQIANLSKSNLSDADLRSANLIAANLCKSNFSGADLHNADLSGSNLRKSNLRSAFLRDANLRYTNLRYAHLRGADLRDADFYSADLSNANLSAVQALQANFQAATLTGTCIADWNINSNTYLQEIICEYVFTGYDRSKDQCTDRRPHDPNQIFAPGEFTKRYQIVLESVDLFFNDGIDWKAFLASLQDLKTEYGEDLNIQGIEKKAGGSFVVRLEVPSDADKGTIERTAKELYETKLQTLEAYYQERLQLRGEQLDFFKEQVEIERIRNTRLERIVETMAEKETPKYDLRGAKFGGGFAADGGSQTGGTFNDFSQNIEQNINEITTLIQSLRGMAEAFPEAQRSEAIEHLTDLETDLQPPPEKRKPSRIKAALLALVGIAAAVSTAVANTNEFVEQVQELSEKLNIPLPIEQVEPKAIDGGN